MTANGRTTGLDYGRSIIHDGRKYIAILDDEDGTETDYWEDAITGEICTIDEEGYDD